jgi:hypothetical protein
MMEIARLLAQDDPVYYTAFVRFAAHFIYIHDAINGPSGLWDQQDGFYYDVLETPSGERVPLRLRSVVGLTPLFASGVVTHIESAALERVVRETAAWILEARPDLRYIVEGLRVRGPSDHLLVAIVRGERLQRILRVLLDESEFLSPYGIRALSKRYEREPYVLRAAGVEFTVRYEPAESSSGIFGGNSNWRGPVWFPVNALLINSLRRYYAFYGDELTVELPTGSGRRVPLNVVADDLTRRLISIFEVGPDGRRPVFGGARKFQTDPNWRENLLFYEYFHGDNGAGIGASHQTGWTGLVAALIDRLGMTGTLFSTAPRAAPSPQPQPQVAPSR